MNEGGKDLSPNPTDSTKQVAPATGNMEAPSPSFELTEHLAYCHLEAAALLCRASLECENQWRGGAPRGEVEWRHKAYVMSSIMSAVAFLDAQIVEVLDDAEALVRSGSTTNNTQVFRSLPSSSVQKLARAVTPSVMKNRPSGKSKIIWKYEAALQSLGHPLINTDDVGVAVNIRNTLVHFRPTRTRVAPGHRVEVINVKLQELGGRELILKPWLSGIGPPIDSMLCHSNAQWVLNACLDYVREFANVTGLVLDFMVGQHRAERLRTR